MEREYGDMKMIKKKKETSPRDASVNTQTN